MVAIAALSLAIFSLLGKKGASEHGPQATNKNIGKDAHAPSILYVYDQFSPEVIQTYRSDITGGDVAAVNIGWGKFSFFPSPDGKYLARGNGSVLEIAPTDKLDSFTKIAEAGGPDMRLYHVVWSDDGNKLVYFTSKKSPTDGSYGPASLPTNLYVINRDGTDKKLVKKFSKLAGVYLEAFDSLRNKLYWFETWEGFVWNFTIVDLADGSIEDIKKDLDPETPWSVTFSPDFSKVYYVGDFDKTIIEYTLANNSKKILYTFDGLGQDKYGNKGGIRGMRLSPRGDVLIFSRRTEPDDREITFSLELSSGKIEQVVDDPRYNVTPVSWSPDGRYVWFEGLCPRCGLESGYDNEGEYYVLDMETKKMNLFFKGEKGEAEKTGEGVRINEGLDFLSWIAE